MSSNLDDLMAVKWIALCLYLLLSLICSCAVANWHERKIRRF